MYYAFIQNNEIYSVGQCPCLNDDIVNVEIAENVYNAIIKDKDRYIWDGVDVVVNSDYEETKRQEREDGFKKEFFETSLGWIRRKPTLADGSEDDFLNNDLPLLAIGLTMGSPVVLPVAYRLPDFTRELTPEYMVSLQILNQLITPQFLQECMQVKMKDFRG